MSKVEYEITGGNNDLLAIATAHRHDVLLVDFYADWCGPCKKIAPMLHEFVAHFAKRKDGGARLILCKVNVDEANNDDLCTAYKVSAMPTLVWISNMKVVNRVEGANVDKITSITNELVQ